MTMTYRWCLALCAAALMSACSPEAPPVEPSGVATETPDMAAESEAPASALAGTAWRLLNITSMNDSVYLPDDPDRYTLEFATDGRASLQADCNRGTGEWSSEGDSQVRFGPIATTRALCPPESLSDKYLAQFEWVRSYVMRDGHLYLATMADGAIIEFEPLNAGR